VTWKKAENPDIHNSALTAVNKQLVKENEWLRGEAIALSNSLDATVQDLLEMTQERDGYKAKLDGSYSERDTQP